MTEKHQIAGEVGAFDVVYKYKVPDNTTAFHIPAVQTRAVPVYTAGVLDYVGHVVDTSGGSGTYIPSGDLTSTALTTFLQINSHTVPLPFIGKVILLNKKPVVSQNMMIQLALQ